MCACVFVCVYVYVCVCVCEPLRIVVQVSARISGCFKNVQTKMSRLNRRRKQIERKYNNRNLRFP